MTNYELIARKSQTLANRIKCNGDKDVMVVMVRLEMCASEAERLVEHLETHNTGNWCFNQIKNDFKIHPDALHCLAYLGIISLIDNKEDYIADIKMIKGKECKVTYYTYKPLY